MLKDLHLYPVYDSAEHSLIDDLIVPLLKESKLYTRGVGYFTSGWIRIASQGLVELIENDGKARIVLSPYLSLSDWQAFQLGENAKVDSHLKELLKAKIEDLSKALERDTLNALAWMIADEVLEFKFAFPREEFRGGDYHDKVAIFEDASGECVAIHGSFNDSLKGSLNGEAFSVFKSWEEGQRGYVMQHMRRLSDLWNNANRQFEVATIPQACKQQLINLRSNERPYKLPLKTDGVLKKITVPTPLRDYQNEAIDAWVRAGCRGILEMATGTGKTITSLGVAHNRYLMHQRIALVILVPYLHLLEQWERQCAKYGFAPILCSSEHDGWQVKVRTTIQNFNIGGINRLCILAVHATAASEKFSTATKLLKAKYTLIIGDEAHSLGASVMRNALISNASMRLGLSATPRRWFDDEGTKTIKDYFGDVCFEFPLEEAINKKFLAPYEYRPELISLSSVEMEQYEEISHQLARLFQGNKMASDDERIKRLLLERALIIASAEQKQVRLIEILDDMKNIDNDEQSKANHILIYCAPGKHQSVLRAVSQLGYKCHEFVHHVPLDRRQQVLDEFQSGNIEVLVAIKCLDEGVDVPATRYAFFLASTTNPREFVQRRGRILRLSPHKTKAIIYDFIVVPPKDLIHARREIDAGLIRREMPRFAEFSDTAINKYEARTAVWELLNHYEMLNLLDKKPWDIYDEMRGTEQDISV